MYDFFESDRDMDKFLQDPEVKLVAGLILQHSEIMMERNLTEEEIKMLVWASAAAFGGGLIYGIKKPDWAKELMQLQ